MLDPIFLAILAAAGYFIKHRSTSIACGVLFALAYGFLTRLILDKPLPTASPEILLPLLLIACIPSALITWGFHALGVRARRISAEREAAELKNRIQQNKTKLKREFAAAGIALPEDGE